MSPTNSATMRCTIICGIQKVCMDSMERLEIFVCRRERIVGGSGRRGGIERGNLSRGLWRRKNMAKCWISVLLLKEFWDLAIPTIKNLLSQFRHYFPLFSSQSELSFIIDSPENFPLSFRWIHPSRSIGTRDCTLSRRARMQLLQQRPQHVQQRSSRRRASRASSAALLYGFWFWLWFSLRWVSLILINGQIRFI